MSVDVGRQGHRIIIIDIALQHLWHGRLSDYITETLIQAHLPGFFLRVSCRGQVEKEYKLITLNYLLKFRGRTVCQSLRLFECSIYVPQPIIIRNSLDHTGLIDTVVGLFCSGSVDIERLRTARHWSLTATSHQPRQRQRS